jgi:hypothetical protein
VWASKILLGLPNFALYLPDVLVVKIVKLEDWVLTFFCINCMHASSEHIGFPSIMHNWNLQAFSEFHYNYSMIEL